MMNHQFKCQQNPTGQPAVDELQLGTETFTRVTGSDQPGLFRSRIVDATETGTKTHVEGVHIPIRAQSA